MLCTAFWNPSTLALIVFLVLLICAALLLKVSESTQVSDASCLLVTSIFASGCAFTTTACRLSTPSDDPTVMKDHRSEMKGL
ncbi:membrane-associated protein, putative [Bodo saltans]|uniref:Membrane-associated protein, putative n=1 Tax=Bodo saltans TaxID=75058 RepID=A0A0S4J1W4_BODSA|nr:membrane-associated protein, putative [Bodo saltans]|eukprot:CUG61945.1 membrane-associated protein, putative [Bodo saltans]